MLGLKENLRWPVYTITAFVGLFVVIVLVMWINSHLIKKEPTDKTAWIILGALVLRALTVVIALASILKWGNKFAPWLILAGLSGCASAQLIYPLAELVVKLTILTGLIHMPSKGLGNMSPTGWFNLGAVWLIFGIPGALFVKVAVNFKEIHELPRKWYFVGGALGIAALFAIGLLIG